jgi:hypothetical protein
MVGLLVGLFVGSGVGAVTLDGSRVGDLLGIDTGCAEGGSDSFIKPYFSIL